jgi:hypothetical protein
MSLENMSLQRGIHTLAPWLVPCRLWAMVGGTVAGALAVSSCAPQPEQDTYFPLDDGRSWTYRVTKNLDEADEPSIDMLELSARGLQDVDGKPALRRHSDNGVDYWFRSDASGIFRIASKNALDKELKADNPPRYVLKKPYTVGTQWEASTVAYILQRKNEVPKEIRYTHKPVVMVYRIDALDQKVQTASGAFEGCMRVLGEAKIKLYVDALFSWRDMPLFSTEWYCPTVGLVRVERVEKSPSRTLRGGTMTLDLVRWRL